MSSHAALPWRCRDGTAAPQPPPRSRRRSAGAAAGRCNRGSTCAPAYVPGQTLQVHALRRALSTRCGVSCLRLLPRQTIHQHARQLLHRAIAHHHQRAIAQRRAEGRRAEVAQPAATRLPEQGELLAPRRIASAGVATHREQLVRPRLEAAGAQLKRRADRCLHCRALWAERRGGIRGRVPAAARWLALLPLRGPQRVGPPRAGAGVAAALAPAHYIEERAVLVELGDGEVELGTHYDPHPRSPKN